MFDFIDKIPPKLLTLGAVIAVVIFVLFGIDWYQKIRQIDGLADAELLKAPKEDILDYREASTVASDNQLQGLVVYHYVSNAVVPPTTYSGLQEDMNKRTPNSQSFLKSTKPVSDKMVELQYIGKFYSAPSWQKKGDKWYGIETATTTKTAFARQTKLTLLDKAKELLGRQVFAATVIDTKYSGAGDGYISGGPSTNWLTIHNAAAGDASDATSITTIAGSGGNIINGEYTIRRAFFPFDTSALPDDAVVSSSTLNFYITAVNFFVTAGNYATIVQTTQDSNTTLAVEDYDQCGAVTDPTEGTSSRLSAASDASLGSIPLNATGMSWISPTGYTKLGVRDKYDTTNSGYETVVGNISLTISTSEETGTTQDPYLTIQYTYIAPDTLKIDGGTLKIDGGTVNID